MPCHSIKISILQRHRLIGRRESRSNIIRLNIRERNRRIRILDHEVRWIARYRRAGPTGDARL